MVFAGAMTYWLTLWLSLQLTLEDLQSGGSRANVVYAPVPPKDVQYWTSHMSDVMHQFTTEEVEFYLPQLTAILLRRDAATRNMQVSSMVSGHLGSFLQGKCRQSQEIGMHMIWQLRSAMHTTSAQLPPAGLTPAQQVQVAQRRKAQWAAMLNEFEQAAASGSHLPERLEERRRAYYRDTMRFIDRLVALSFQMQAMPRNIRMAHLQLQLSDINKSLLRRMASHGRQFELPPGTPIGQEWPLDEAEVAKLCPEAARYALHLPLRVMSPTGEDGRCVMRVLRVAKEMCQILPSRERAPYLVTCEVLQTSLRFGSDRVYCQGDVELTALDMLSQRSLPQGMQEELSAANREEEFMDPAGMEAIASTTEEEDKAFFERAFAQYLQMGSRANPYIHRMRLILSQVFENVRDLRERVLREASPFGRLKGWKLASFIVKAGDDIRQEALAMQVISLVDQIFKRDGLPLWLRPYAIVAVGDKAGLVEYMQDAKSIDHIKKTTPDYVSMADLFERLYMGRGAGLFGRAQDNFVRSLAAYSIITYLLQVKDRHNANIMMDSRGHILHIDFGFILGNSPGMWKHETAPFKLTQDYLDILGGEGSPNWIKFRELFLAGFKAVQAHIDEIVALVKVSMPPSDRRALVQVGKEWPDQSTPPLEGLLPIPVTGQPLFKPPHTKLKLLLLLLSWPAQVELLRKRFRDVRGDEDILGLIDRSSNSWTTQQYDLFQYMQNGISA
ncbi:unnamed protein product [Chrysoparadoxa australica]